MGISICFFAHLLDSPIEIGKLALLLSRPKFMRWEFSLQSRQKFNRSHSDIITRGFMVLPQFRLLYHPSACDALGCGDFPLTLLPACVGLGDEG